METTIFYWRNTSLSETTGYNHLEIIPSKDIFKVAKLIHKKGLNVMIVHQQSNNSVLYIDDEKFEQR